MSSGVRISKFFQIIEGGIRVQGDFELRLSKLMLHDSGAVFQIFSE